MKEPRISATDAALTRIEQVRVNRKQPQAGLRIAITGRENGAFVYDMQLVASGEERHGDMIVAFIHMGGGCQGCGMAELTLGQGVRTAILDTFPEIHEVRETTDHAQGANPYYQAAKK
jgi:NifU-like protein